MTRYNILQDRDDKLHIIDWEHFGVNIFYFDIFYLILNEAIRNKNDVPLKCLLTGEIDQMLNSFFQTYGFMYEKKKIRMYLMTICHHSNKRFEINQIKEAIKKVEYSI